METFPYFREAGTSVAGDSQHNTDILRDRSDPNALKVFIHYSFNPQVANGLISLQSHEVLYRFVSMQEHLLKLTAHHRAETAAKRGANVSTCGQG